MNSDLFSSKFAASGGKEKISIPKTRYIILKLKRNGRPHLERWRRVLWSCPRAIHLALIFLLLPKGSS